MTQPELDATIEAVKAYAGLTHWRHTASFASAEEMAGNLGDCEMFPERLYFHVRILHPSEPNPDLLPRDPKADAVHEAFHVVFWMFEPTDPESLLGKLLEQAVESLAQGYLKLLRDLESR